MPDSSHDDRLLAWGLGTFHTNLFVLALVVFLFLQSSLGGLLAGLNTLAGFALFGALWASTTWCTGRALRNIASQEAGAMTFLNMEVDFNRLAGQGLLWGAVNGVLFFSVLVLFLLATLFLQPTTFGSPDAFGLFSICCSAGLSRLSWGQWSGFCWRSSIASCCSFYGSSLVVLAWENHYKFADFMEFSGDIRPPKPADVVLALPGNRGSSFQPRGHLEQQRSFLIRDPKARPRFA